MKYVCWDIPQQMFSNHCHPFDAILDITSYTTHPIHVQMGVEQQYFSSQENFTMKFPFKWLVFSIPIEGRITGWCIEGLNAPFLLLWSLNTSLITESVEMGQFSHYSDLLYISENFKKLLPPDIHHVVFFPLLQEYLNTSLQPLGSCPCTWFNFLHILSHFHP